MERRIDLEDGNKLIIIKNTEYCGYTVKINKGYFEKNELIKTITLSRTEDFLFEGWFDDSINDMTDTNRLEFCFDEKDPLHKHLLQLLSEDSSLIIDDDNTREENKKTMTVYKKDNLIYIAFENRLENATIAEKFNIFIKNIVTDYRSKIDEQGLDTKLRLLQFFANVHTELLPEERENKPAQKVYKK